MTMPKRLGEHFPYHSIGIPSIAIAVCCLLSSSATATRLSTELGVGATASTTTRRSLQQSAEEDAAPRFSAQFRQCHADDSSRAFAIYHGFATVGKCAKAALAAGYTTFAMQCPTCSPNPNEAQCFYGDKGLLGSQSYVRVPGQNCNGGLGARWTNAVWFIDYAAAPGSRPYITVSLARPPTCYADDSSRAFAINHGYATVTECARAALTAGHAAFAMQCSHCHSDPDKAQCFYGDKGVLGSQPYVKVSDQDCNEGLGGGWRNAVWSFNDGE
mmetsp:Transcript_7437/g.19073  ORF Transcript_7437/g.19073 Transcript_7437/m.19073 type:complete len:272 (+) Transcript_7437:173-988(+)